MNADDTDQKENQFCFSLIGVIRLRQAQSSRVYPWPKLFVFLLGPGVSAVNRECLGVEEVRVSENVRNCPIAEYRLN
jgi:hypothetical protein